MDIAEVQKRLDELKPSQAYMLKAAITASGGVLELKSETLLSNLEEMPDWNLGDLRGQGPFGQIQAEQTGELVRLSLRS